MLCQLIAVSGNVITDMGCSDHFLVWVELAKNSKKGKCVFKG